MWTIEILEGTQYTRNVGDANTFETLDAAHEGVESLVSNGFERNRLQVREYDFAEAVQARIDQICAGYGPRKSSIVVNEAVDSTREDGGWGRVRIEDGFCDGWEGPAEEALELLEGVEADDVVGEDGPDPWASIWAALMYARTIAQTIIQRGWADVSMGDNYAPIAAEWARRRSPNWILVGIVNTVDDRFELHERRVSDTPTGMQDAIRMDSFIVCGAQY